MDFNWIWKAILIIIVGILLLRLSGRRSISQSTIPQTIIMISIGTLLIQPVSGKNLWITFSIAFVLIVTLLAIEFAQMKWDFLEMIFIGRSKIIIENGVLQEKNLKKMHLSVDKLEMRLRQKGIKSIKDVQWATIEPSGQLGYFLTDKNTPATKNDIEKLQEEMKTMQEMITSLATKLNESYLSRPLNQEQTKASSNLFSEIKKGHKPLHPDRLE